jgi:YHS domain-containing protein
MRISSRFVVYLAVIVIVALFSAVAATALVKAPAKHTKKISAVCPVMGSAIPDVSKAAGKSVYQGKTYYFCCSACKPMFDANPAKYVKVVKPKAPVKSNSYTGASKSECKGGVCPIPKSTKATGAKNTPATKSVNKHNTKK